MKFHHILPDLLGTKAKALLLQTLMDFPSAQKTGREWAAMAHVSPPQAMQAFRTFENYGMVSWRPAGKSRLWTLNGQHVYVSALQAFLNVENDFTRAFLDALRSQLDKTTFSKIVEISLFGSVARHSDVHGSDVDLFVLVSESAASEPIRQACLAVSVQLIDRFGAVAMPLVVSQKELGATNPLLLKNIHHDGARFYGGPQHGARH